MHNVEKWPNKLLKSCGVIVARFATDSFSFIEQKIYSVYEVMNKWIRKEKFPRKIEKYDAMVMAEILKVYFLSNTLFE